MLAAVSIGGCGKTFKKTFWRFERFGRFRMFWIAFGSFSNVSGRFALFLVCGRRQLECTRNPGNVKMCMIRCVSCELHGVAITKKRYAHACWKRQVSLGTARMHHRAAVPNSLPHDSTDRPDTQIKSTFIYAKGKFVVQVDDSLSK